MLTLDIADSIRLSLLHHFGNDRVYFKYLNDIRGIIDAENLLSLPEYSRIAYLLADDRDKTIIDIGCGTGEQQLLFDDFKAYIGIDILHVPIEIGNNVSVYKGDCKDVLKKMDPMWLYYDCVAVSLHAGSCFPDIGNEVKKYFSRIIML
jgi:SAM-dependent methyltransferase